MATDVERLTVLMEANTKQFNNAMKKVQRDVDKSFRRGSSGVRKFDLSLSRAASSARTLASAFGVGFVAGGLATLPQTLKQITAEASRVIDVANKVNLTTDALQEMRFAAEQTGVASNQLDMGMQRFSRRLAEAASGTGVLKDVLAANNIALRDSQGRIRPTIDLLGDYANLIKGAASEQDKLRLAFLAFDSEGAAMVNTLRDGRDGLELLRQKARDASAVMDEKLLVSGKKVDDQFNTLTATIGTRFKSAILTGIGALDDLADKFESVEKTAANFGNSSIFEKLADLVGADRDAALPGMISRNEAERLRLGASSPGAGPDRRGRRPAAIVTKIPGTPETDKEADKAVERIGRVTTALEQQLVAVQLNTRGQEVYNQLTAAGTDLNSEAGQKIARLATMIQDHEDATRQAALATQYFGQIGESALDRLIVGGEKLTDVLGDVVKELGIAAAKAALFGGSNPFGALLGGGTGGAGSLLGSLFGGGGGDLLGGLFGGFRADGGPVDAGKAYIVGERGPELFRPSQSGQVVPNGGGPGSTAVVRIEGLDPRKLYTGAAIEQVLDGLKALKRKGWSGEFA